MVVGWRGPAGLWKHFGDADLYPVAFQVLGDGALGGVGGKELIAKIPDRSASGYSYR